MDKPVIGIFGMPRSGTSFLGQIFDSSESVSYRLEPIFSYLLKNQIDEHSCKAQIMDFFERCLVASDDAFMNQLDKRRSGSYPTFKKQSNKKLVFKTTRFHHMLPRMMEQMEEDLKIVYIVRNPCAAINSWLRHPREFPQELDPLSEWRGGVCRKTAREEFWGFDDWIKTTKQAHDLAAQYPNFRVFSYENLVRSVAEEVAELFAYCDLLISSQVRDFLLQSQLVDNQDPYSVFKTPDVVDRWKATLPDVIRSSIVADLTGSEFERYL